MLKTVKTPALTLNEKRKKRTPNLNGEDPRKMFYIEEEKRAKERHEWEREEHEKKMELLNLKIKLKQHEEKLQQQNMFIVQ